jgi:hypothetical protein
LTAGHYCLISSFALEGTMNSFYLKSMLRLPSTVIRIALPCLLLVLLVEVAYSQSKHHPASNAVKSASTTSDVLSGFIPGAIDIFAGNGNNTATVSNSVATETGIYGGPGSVASDSLGDVVFSQTGAAQNSIYMVYAGGTIPQILAAVTTQAKPTVTPLKGHVYEIDCGCVNLGTTLSQSGVNVSSLWFDSSDNLYIADATVYSSAFKVNSTTGNIQLVAGVQGQPGSYSLGDTISGTATNAKLNLADVKTDFYGNIYIADSTDSVVLVVYLGSQVPPVLTAEGVSSPKLGDIYTIAGVVQHSCYTDTSLTCAASGAANGFILGSANSIAVDASGNVYILDSSSLIVDVIYAGVAAPALLTAEGIDSSASGLAAGNIYAVVGYNNLTQYASCPQASSCGDGGLANDVWFAHPKYMAIDTSGDVYVSDTGEHAIRKIDAAGSASTVAGIDDPSQTVPGVATIAADKAAAETPLNAPYGIAFDPQNNLYIADMNYYIVWQASPAQSQTITFPTLESSATYGDKVTLGATASSGLDVYYAVTGSAKIVCPSGSTTVSPSNSSALTCVGNSTNAELQFTGAGSNVTVTASQPGGSVASDGTTTYYAPATAASGTSLAQTVDTVNPAQLTVTAQSPSLVYPSTINAATLATLESNYPPTVTGWVNTSDSSSTSVSALYTTSAPAGTPDAGVYTLSVSGGSLSGSAASGYTISNYKDGTLTITGATAQSINFPAFTSAVAYGQTKTVALAAASYSGASLTGLPITYTVVKGPGTVSGSVLTITGAGAIVVQASQTGSDTYAGATPVQQSLTVNPAALTVSASTVATSSYGFVINATNLATLASTYPPTITGWVVSSDAGKWTCGNACYTTNATGTPDASTTPYTLSVVPGDLALDSSIAANYTFATFNPGTLTITKASQTINYVAPSSITYGAYPTVTASANSGLAVTATATGALTLTSSSSGTTFNFNATGVGAATITLTQAGTTDYAAATLVFLPFTVDQAPLYVTANSYTREQGAANPTFTYTIGTSTAGAVGGFQNGDTDIPSVVSGVPVLTTTATQASSPGTYSIVVDTTTVTTTKMFSTNYYFVPVNGTLTVTQPGTYAITANPSSLTIQRGLRAQSTITITPSNDYQGTITLTCGALPANVTCTVSPSTYTFTGEYVSNSIVFPENPQQGTITINTTSATVVGTNSAQKSNVSLAGFLIPGALAGLFLLFARKRVAKIATFWSLCALLALGIGAALGLTSCGGSSVNTTATAGTQTITLTGTGTTPSGGTVTATVPLTVTIQ